MIIKEIEPLDRLGRFIAMGISSAVSVASIGYAVAPLAKIGTTSIEYSKIHVKNIFSNVSLIMLQLVTQYFFNFLPIQPACIIGGIPLGTVEELSHAMSDKILKFRATGGIFLAHQEGGENTLRIIGKAFGKNRYIFLSLLDFLFMYGSAKVVDLFVDFIKGSLGVVPTLSPSMVSEDPWSVVRESSLDTGTEEVHLTFPVITRTKVYTNMYIETYEFTESIENGINCLNYSIFLRKYQASYPYKFAKKKDEFEDNYIYYYAEDKDDELISRLRLIDLAMEAGFSTAMIMYRFFQFLSGNSIETSIGHITGIAINEQNLGIDKTTELLKRVYTNLDYDLSELSVSQKEVLMQID